MVKDYREESARALCSMAWEGMTSEKDVARVLGILDEPSAAGP